MADRFYTSEALQPGEITLDGPEAHHLAHVRRFESGEVVTLFNGDGREYPAEIVGIAKKHVTLRIIGVESPQRELGFTLHVAAALPKGDRGDFLIEKLTELGATDFTPLLTERGIVIPKPSTVEKLQRAVIEASKQCGRNVLLRVHPPRAIEKWALLPELPQAKWIAHPNGSVPDATAISSTGVAIAIGPEGGFTDDEVAGACGMGFAAISLGPRILRVETAAIALVSRFAIEARQ